MKNGRYAIYNGKEYSADYIKGKGIILRSYDEKDLQKGFQEYNGFDKSIVGIKFVDKSQVSEFYRARTIAKYQGYTFEVVDEIGNQISIVTMVGDYQEWKRLEMKCIDKGVYQKWIDRDEAEIIIEKETSN